MNTGKSVQLFPYSLPNYSDVRVVWDYSCGVLIVDLHRKAYELPPHYGSDWFSFPTCDRVYFSKQDKLLMYACLRTNDPVLDKGTFDDNVEISGRNIEADSIQDFTVDICNEVTYFSGNDTVFGCSSSYNQDNETEIIRITKDFHFILQDHTLSAWFLKNASMYLVPEGVPDVPENQTSSESFICLFEKFIAIVPQIESCGDEEIPYLKIETDALIAEAKCNSDPRQRIIIDSLQGLSCLLVD